MAEKKDEKSKFQIPDLYSVHDAVSEAYPRIMAEKNDEKSKLQIPDLYSVQNAVSGAYPRWPTGNDA